MKRSSSRLLSVQTCRGLQLVSAHEFVAIPGSRRVVAKSREWQAEPLSVRGRLT